MSEAHVVLVTDRNCVRGCAVTMRSIMDNIRSSLRVRFHLFTNGVEERDRDALERTVTESGTNNAEVSLRSFDPSSFKGLVRSKLISLTAYAALGIGEILPPSVNRCIYADCDLAVETDIGDLWDTDLEGRTLGAVENGSREDALSHQARLALREARYFNSGVLLADLDRWRELHVGERALAVAREVGPRLILHDQDALNRALQGDWTPLPWYWNVWVIDPALRPDSHAVFHYMGAPKPWHADFDRPYAEKFYKYLDRTPYAGWRPWNPGGWGARARRLRRKVPYLPGALRALKARFTPPPTPEPESDLAARLRPQEPLG